MTIRERHQAGETHRKHPTKGSMPEMGVSVSDQGWNDKAYHEGDLMNPLVLPHY